jgi:prepilin-type N-terminal cleavage/methylation domain-containing protein
MSAISRTEVSAIGRRAFTLVEMLIAMALTLILVYAIAEFYAYVGNTVKDGRAMIEMNNLMRVATTRLKADLELLTVPVVPWADDGSSMGYFLIYEGAAKDWDVNNNTLLDLTEDLNTNSIPDIQEANISSLNGDSDDVLAFTIRSPNEPFTGQHLGVTISSSLAEVIWFTGFTETDTPLNNWQADEPMFLYRRQLLIRPDIDLATALGTHANVGDAQMALVNYWQTSSVSASVRQGVDGMGNTVYRVVANSLADLGRREHRFAHTPSPGGSFPHAMLFNPKSTASVTTFTMGGASAGEDRVLSNLLSFDVRVFDPTAPLRADGELTDTDSDVSNDAQGTIQPGDPGWDAAVAANLSDPGQCPVVGFGAYVDLFYTRPGYSPGTATSTFSDAPVYPGSLANAAAYRAILGTPYDTWALSYERDGINQDAFEEGMMPLLDEGTDGLDNNGTSGVDDPGERETSPPYPVPLRGIQVRIRVLEPASRQMRQATVGADFIQE